MFWSKNNCRRIRFPQKNPHTRGVSKPSRLQGSLMIWSKRMQGDTPPKIDVDTPLKFKIIQNPANQVVVYPIVYEVFIHPRWLFGMSINRFFWKMVEVDTFLLGRWLFQGRTIKFPECTPQMNTNDGLEHLSPFKNGNVWLIINLFAKFHADGCFVKNLSQSPIQ